MFLSLMKFCTEYLRLNSLLSKAAATLACTSMSAFRSINTMLCIYFLAISSCYMKSTKPEATLLTIRNKSLLSISLTHRIFAELLCALCICLYIYPFVRPSVQWSVCPPRFLFLSLTPSLSLFLLSSSSLSVSLSASLFLLFKL